ncbi:MULTISPECIES: hypothetical protein [Clostridiaceae]|uniref:DUF2927 domain-containing protein n=1 Tax=Clostridium facile TaxID=2763035 RepID=A0ABR7IU13_9CLOT|nr:MULTISPECIES: hypothetical protein [Clostridiaceae]MBC5788322.1 hypothetical protein [Clostridium facile]PWN00534.1 MAG: hypothetical protein DBX37_01420 [Massilioclostridium sp.]
MEKRFAVFISVLLSAIIIITSDIIVDYRYRNSFNEWIQYQVPQTAKAYKKIQQDFHYTMDNDAIIPKKFDFTYEKNSIFHEDENKDAYFMLNNYQEKHVSVIFQCNYAMGSHISRSFYINLLEIESDHAALIDIISASCNKVVDSSLTLEEANGLAVQILLQQSLPYHTPLHYFKNYSFSLFVDEEAPLSYGEKILQLAVRYPYTASILYDEIADYK